MIVTPIKTLHPILVVEDDEATRKLLRQFIELEGTPVVEAENGIEALEYLLSEKMLRPLAVLLDLSMPKMNGARFIETLRADPRMANLPVIVTSAWTDVEARAAKMGVEFFLKKPFDLDSLRRALEKFLYSEH